MEYIPSEECSSTKGTILCCQCGTVIEPNPSNMCIGCLRAIVDITEGIPKQMTIYCCRGCDRYLQPPNQWVSCQLESREMLAFCLKKLKGLNRVHLVDATFVWTEPHSKRIKIKLTVRKEVLGGAILQQVFVVEYTVNNQMCPNCHRVQAKDFWKALVQVRQKVEHKKTFFYLEQLILKHSAHMNCLNIKSKHEGIDFFFGKKDDARKLVDFLQSVVPCKYITAQQLVSHDVHSNVYNYKHTFSVEIVPVCKNDVVCLPLPVSHSLGNISQICICLRVTTTIHLIDPNTLQLAELSSQQYWRTPFQSIGMQKQLTEYTVMDLDNVLDSERRPFAGQGPLSVRHSLADIWVVRSCDLGVASEYIHCRTHLGHILKPGDLVLGFDLANANINNSDFEKVKKKGRIPDVILVKKIYGDKSSRQRKRKWKLKRLNVDADTDTSSMNRDYTDFLEDLEEDPGYRQNVNIYVDHDKLAAATDDTDDEGLPHITLQDMLEDLSLNADEDGEGDAVAMLE